MSSQEIAKLTQTLEETIDSLERLLYTPVDLTENLASFFEYLNRSDIKKYLFVRGSNDSENSLPDAMRTSEIYGVYKFYPSIGKHIESNYCKIAIPGIHCCVANSLKNPIQLPLSSLVNPNIKIEHKESIVNGNGKSETIVKWEDLAKAIKELRDHYQETLIFL